MIWRWARTTDLRSHSRSSGPTYCGTHSKTSFPGWTGVRAWSLLLPRSSPPRGLAACAAAVGRRRCPRNHPNPTHYPTPGDREALAAQAEAEAAAAASKKKTAQRVAAKNFSLMSFGDEAEEEDAGAAEAARTMRLASAHDALDDASLSKQAALEVDLQRCVSRDWWGWGWGLVWAEEGPRIRSHCAGCGGPASLSGIRTRQWTKRGGPPDQELFLPPTLNRGRATVARGARQQNQSARDQSRSCIAHHSVRERLRAAKEEKAGGAPGRPMSDLESRMRDRVAARAAAHAQHDATPPAAREQAGEQAAGVGVEADALGLGHQSAHGAAADRRRREGGRDAGTSNDDSDGEEGRKPGHTRSLPGTGRGARSSAAVVAPSKQVRVADADLLSQWEQRRKVSAPGDCLLRAAGLVAPACMRACQHDRMPCGAALVGQAGRDSDGLGGGLRGLDTRRPGGDWLPGGHPVPPPPPRRQEYKERKRLGGDRQRDTLAKLGKFTSKLRVDTKRDDAAPPAGEHPAAGADAKGALQARPGPSDTRLVDAGACCFLRKRRARDLHPPAQPPAMTLLLPNPMPCRLQRQGAWGSGPCDVHASRLARRLVLGRQRRRRRRCEGRRFAGQSPQPQVWMCAGRGCGVLPPAVGPRPRVAHVPG